MKEQLISFDTAKLAKEKGFDFKTEDFFQYNEKTFGVREESGLPRYYADGCSQCSRPTQSLLETWLFEKHNIHIEITFDDGTWIGYIGEFSFPDSSVEPIVTMETEGFKDAKKRKTRIY